MKVLNGIESLNKTEVKNLLWEGFIKWMYGQTYAEDEHRTPYYYKHDVERFIKGLPVID